MPTWAPLNDDPNTGDSIPVAFLELEGRTVELRTCFVGAVRVENRNALPAASPLNAGLLVYRITDGELYVADLPVSGGWKGLLSITPAASFDTVELPLEGDVGNDAVSPPTKTRKGALEGWLFDDVLEKRTLAFVVPTNSGFARRSTRRAMR